MVASVEPLALLAAVGAPPWCPVGVATLVVLELRAAQKLIPTLATCICPVLEGLGLLTWVPGGWARERRGGGIEGLCGVLLPRRMRWFVVQGL